MDSDTLLRVEESHDIEYRTQLVIDGEVIKTVTDHDLQIVTGVLAEAELADALNEYLSDELIGSEQDYYDRESKEVLHG